MKYLYNRSSEATAELIHDYPYGYTTRTDIRYWIETKAKKGDRFCSQTLNPKTGNWNKPKCSTYSEIMVMIEHDNGHINYTSFSHWDDAEKLAKWLENKDQTQFNAEQIDQLCRLKAIFKVRENLTFTCEVRPTRTAEDQKIHDDEQDKISQNINKLGSYYYNQFKKETE